MADSNPITTTPSSPPPLYPIPVTEQGTLDVDSLIEPIVEHHYPERDSMDGRRELHSRVAANLERLNSTFKHPQTLFISSPSSQIEHVDLEDGDWVIPVTITDPVTPGGNLTVHHWTRDGETGTVLSTDLTTDNLSYVYGFRELGEFVVTVKPEEDVHEALTALVRRSHASSGETNEEGDMIAGLIEELKKETAKEEKNESSVTLQLYSITVFSREEANPFNSEDNVWMWTKPNSNYAKKSGDWDKSLDEVVHQGEWAAGRELRVLVEAVTKKQREWFLGSFSYPATWDEEERQ